jgi:hypothetical protein
LAAKWDKAWEQKKLEATLREMFNAKRAAESSGRFVRRLWRFAALYKSKVENLAKTHNHVPNIFHNYNRLF